MKIKAIDISYAQPAVDFQAVKKAGVKAVIIRNGYLNKTDTHFNSHMKGAIAAGLDVGTYTYIMSNTVEDAKKEAQQTVERLKPYKGHLNYPVFCDMESKKYYSDKFNNRLRTDIIIAFCEEIKKAGYYAALYINPSWLEEWTNKEELLGKYDIWLAAWTQSADIPTKYNYGQSMWQWGTATIKGINGPVDSNLVYVDYPKIIASKGKNFYSAKVENRKNVKEVYESYGEAAIRSGYNRNSNNINGRCEKGRLYLIDGTITIDGVKWLRHADGTGYSMYKDGLILFKKTGNYKEYKTTTNLNVRSKPILEKKYILGVLNKGSAVYITGKSENGWFPCIYKGGSAYVSADYVEEV